MALDAQVIHATTAPGSGVAGRAICAQIGMRGHSTAHLTYLVASGKRARAKNLVTACLADDNHKQQSCASKLQTEWSKKTRQLYPEWSEKTG